MVKEDCKLETLAEVFTVASPAASTNRFVLNALMEFISAFSSCFSVTPPVCHKVTGTL